MNSISQNILKVLAYFDYFNHPLTSEEIRSFMPLHYAQTSIDNALRSLHEDGIVFKTGEFYSLQNEPSLAERRILGHQVAIKQLLIAQKAAKFLSRFPYVQTVAVSGSLSKYYADKNTDIDFFIITSANRLWIARTCMHIFKKLSFIAGKQDWFCMNYYIDERQMEIQEKNIFTAMEIVTLMPMEGISHFQKFIIANSWINNYFPARKISNNASEIKKGFIRNGFEKIFNAHFADSIDNWLMNVTDKRWKKKSGKTKSARQNKRIGMSVSKHFSKPDPANFQAKLLKEYEQRITELTTAFLHVPAG